MKTLNLLLILPFYYGCTTFSQPPIWIEQPYRAYSNEQYLVAVGTGNTYDLASERALSSLAKIFEVTVEDQGWDFAEAQLESKDGAYAIHNRAQHTRHLMTFTHQVLEGARILESWHGNDGLYYSLAALEKTPTARQLRTEIDKLDQLTSNLLDYANDSAPNAIAALSAMEHAKQTQLERQQLNRNLSVVTATKGVLNRSTAVEIAANMRSYLSKLVLTLTTQDDWLHQNAQSAVAQLGANVGADSMYQLNLALISEPVVEQEQWYWARATLQIKIKYGEQTINSKYWSLKQAASEKGTATQRLQNLVVMKMPVYLREVMLDQKIIDKTWSP